MAIRVSAKLDTKEFRRVMKRFRDTLKPAQMRNVMKKIGIQMLTFIDRDYKERSNAADSTWESISPLTAILRTRGRRGKIGSWADAFQVAQTLPKLTDKGLLRASFRPSATGRNKVFNAKPESVEVGSNDPRARLHQDGGESEGINPAEVEGRVKANTTKDFFFQVMNAIRANTGPRDVPQREIISDFSSVRQQVLVNILHQETLEKAAKGR